MKDLAVIALLIAILAVLLMQVVVASLAGVDMTTDTRPNIVYGTMAPHTTLSCHVDLTCKQGVKETAQP